MILIDDMKETLVSISELCKGGLINKQNLVVFTWEGMRGFEMNEASRYIHIDMQYVHICVSTCIHIYVTIPMCMNVRSNRVTYIRVFIITSAVTSESKGEGKSKG